MVDAREDRQWYHTASIMAMIAEVNRNPKKRRKAFTATQFHPMHITEKPQAIEFVELRVLKAIFVDRKTSTV